MFFEILKAFLEGLLTPLTAVCVLPLYPGFIAYLSNRAVKSPFKLSLMITLGIITFMSLLGLIFTTLLQVSLTNVIGILSPIAFGILGIVSLFLIFDFDFSRFMPQLQSPQAKKPGLEAFLFGFFFGIIVIPCNPGFIALFFAQVSLATNFMASITQFLAFAVGLAFPLIVLASISATSSKKVIGFLTKHKRSINLVTGIIMLVISFYYLFFVFKIL